MPYRAQHVRTSESPKRAATTPSTSSRVGHDYLVSSTKPLYVFIDESGDFNFTQSGTDHFVMSAFMARDPMECGEKLSNLKYEFLSRGLQDQIPFHATENSAGTRMRVIGTLCEDHHCWVHTIYADKHLAHPSKHSPEVFYALMGGALGKYLLKSANQNEEPIVMMFDAALSSKHRSAFLKAVKPLLNQIGRRYYIMFKPVKEDVNGQIADYFAWATFRKLETGDDSWLEMLKARAPRGNTSEFNLFKTGHTRYW